MTLLNEYAVASRDQALRREGYIKRDMLSGAHRDSASLNAFVHFPDPPKPLTLRVEKDPHDGRCYWRIAEKKLQYTYSIDPHYTLARWLTADDVREAHAWYPSPQRRALWNSLEQFPYVTADGTPAQDRERGAYDNAG